MAHSKGTWKPGKIGGSVITDNPEGFEPQTGHSDQNYYGGCLIAESIWKQDDVKLIAAAPDLLHACQVAIGEIRQAPTDFSRTEIRKIIENAINKAIG